MANGGNANKAQMNKQQEANKGIHKTGTSGGGPAARRTCLLCGKLFDSIGRGNRICHSCYAKGPGQTGRFDGRI